MNSQNSPNCVKVIKFMNQESFCSRITDAQIFRYGRNIFCLPHLPNFSDIFDLCLHWVSVVRAFTNPNVHVVHCTNTYLPVTAGLIKNVIQTYSRKHFEIEKQSPKIYFPLMNSNEWIHANLLLIHTIAY